MKWLANLLRRFFSKPGNCVAHAALSHGKCTISAKVFRAKTGKWENLGVISRND